MSDYEVLNIPIHAASDLPRGSDIAYRCKICGGILSSVPKDNIGCKCSNICIDIEYVRIFINNLSELEVVRMAPKTPGKRTKRGGSS
jgi:hypothetical protein